MLHTLDFLQRGVIHPCHFRGFHTIIVQMNNLFFFHLHINSTKQFHRLCHCLKIHGNKIGNVHIQIFVQHVDHFLGTAGTVRRIGKSIGIISIFIFSQTQIGIPVYRHQFYFLGVVIDACYDHRITVPVTLQLVIPAVDSYQCDRGISFHDLVFRHALIHIKFFFIDRLVIQLSKFRIYKQSAHQDYQNDNFQCEHHSAQRTSPTSASDSFLSVRQVFLLRHVSTPYDSFSFPILRTFCLIRILVDKAF